MKMADNLVKITVRSNEEYSFIIGNKCTFDELGKILLYIIMSLALLLLLLLLRICQYVIRVYSHKLGKNEILATAWTEYIIIYNNIFPSSSKMHLFPIMKEYSSLLRTVILTKLSAIFIDCFNYSCA
jgi:nitric oxide reductase large subunit